MRFATESVISAEPRRVWQALTDIASWPDWTESVQRAARLDDGPFRVGSTARLKQPRLLPSVWRVTVLTPPDPDRPAVPAVFDWVSRSGGVTTVARHNLVTLDDGRVRVEHAIEMTGLLGPLVRWLGGDLVRRYVRMEAEGLRRYCERG